MASISPSERQYCQLEEMENTKEILKRKVQKYRKALGKLSFTENKDTLYVYDSSLLPGINFYKYLASVPERSKEFQHSLGDFYKERPLQMNIPDTLVYDENNNIPIWIYSDKEGYVRRSINFNLINSSEIVKQFGGKKNLLEPIAVIKEPILKCTRNNQSFLSLGTQTILMNTTEFLNTIENQKDKKKTFCLQRFIKPKGNKACILRVIYQIRKPLIAWSIINNETFLEDNYKSYLTHPYIDSSCSFIQLNTKAASQVFECHQRLIHYMENCFSKSLETLVTDYIKDDMDHYWFIQTKCFRFRDKLPCVLSSSLMKCFEFQSQNLTLKHLHEVKQENLNNQLQNDTNISKFQLNKVQRLQSCKCCGISFPMEDILNKMTLQMIQQTVNRVRFRFACTKSLSFLFCNNLITHKETDQRNGLKDSSFLYQPHGVCKICYSLYEAEMKLISIEKQFSKALDLPNENAMECNTTPFLSSLSSTENTISESSSSSYSSTSSFIPAIDRKQNNLLSNLHKNMELAHCRLTLFVQALFDIPKELYDAQHQQNSHHLYLKYSFGGYNNLLPLVSYSIEKADDSLKHKTGEYWIPIHSFQTFHFFAPSTPLSGSLDENHGLGSFFMQHKHINIQLIRLKDKKIKHEPQMNVFSPSPPLSQSKSNLKSTKSFNFSSLSSHRRHALHKNNSVVLGSMNVNLLQFCSAFVTQMDVYCSMKMKHGGKNDEIFNFKGKIGLERISQVLLKDVQALYKLHVYHSILIPDISFTSNTLICHEWMNSLPAASRPFQSYTPRTKDLQHHRYLHKKQVMSYPTQNDDELEELIHQQELIHQHPTQDDDEDELVKCINEQEFIDQHPTQNDEDELEEFIHQQELINQENETSSFVPIALTSD